MGSNSSKENKKSNNMVVQVPLIYANIKKGEEIKLVLKEQTTPIEQKSKNKI